MDNLSRCCGLSLCEITKPFAEKRGGISVAELKSEDFAPILPWLGVMWWGLASGRWILARRPRWLTDPLPMGVSGLALLGRWSLSFYMVHQPVLIGTLLLVMWLR